MFYLVRLHTCFLPLGVFVIIIHIVASSLRTNDLWARHPAKSGPIHRGLQPLLYPNKAKPLWLPFDRRDIWSLAEPGCIPRPLISPIKLCFMYMGKSPPLASPLAFICLDSYWLWPPVCCVQRTQVTSGVMTVCRGGASKPWVNVPGT